MRLIERTRGRFGALALVGLRYQCPWHRMKSRRDRISSPTSTMRRREDVLASLAAQAEREAEAGRDRRRTPVQGHEAQGTQLS